MLVMNYTELFLRSSFKNVEAAANCLSRIMPILESSTPLLRPTLMEFIQTSSLPPSLLPLRSAFFT
jgi:hypothetical protein